MHGSPHTTQREADIKRAGEKPDSAVKKAEKEQEKTKTKQDTEVNKNAIPAGGPRAGGVHAD
jgi:hypothetical protein